MRFWPLSPRAVRNVVAEVQADLAELGVIVQTPVVIMRRPSRRLRRLLKVHPKEPGVYAQIVADPGYEETADDKAPEAIYLFSWNIKPPTLEEARTVVLHELGHACGFSEAAVADLGL